MPPDAPIYLDNQASTPVDPRVLDVVLPFLTDHVGNASSVQHDYGRQAAAAVETAREQVANLVGAQPRELVFTSGATESNNLALKGIAAAAPGSRGHIVSCVTEHPAVLEPLRALELDGWSVTYLGADAGGEIDLEELDGSITRDTVLVSLMAANNELGTIHPLQEIGRIAHAHGALFHTDAAQAVGKVPLDVELLGVDLLSISGHKLYGPQGIGALYVRRHLVGRLRAQIHGGGQEGGRRSGTSNTGGCVGLGMACAIAETELVQETTRVTALRERLELLLKSGVSDVQVNGPPRARCLAGTLHVTFPGADADAVMANCPDVAIAAGSACSSAAPAPSHVLRAIGMSEEHAESSLRLSLGRFTTLDEVERAGSLIVKAVTRVRSLSGVPSHENRLAPA
jgi:cysteine desulfurase